MRPTERSDVSRSPASAPWSRQQSRLTGAARFSALNHPRRHHIRLAAASIAYGATATGFALGAASALAQGAAPAVPGGLSAAALACALRARRQFRASERNRVGAQSEEHVARVLTQLDGREGWRVSHSIDWPGPGDIDSCVIGPTVAVAVETKTRSYSTAQLARARRAAAWLGKRHRDRAAVAVLVICAAHAVQRWESGVLVVSADRLPGALRALDAGDLECAGLRDGAAARQGDRLDGHARG